jgi:hypothetical protein
MAAVLPKRSLITKGPFLGAFSFSRGKSASSENGSPPLIHGRSGRKGENRRSDMDMNAMGEIMFQIKLAIASFFDRLLDYPVIILGVIALVLLSWRFLRNI